MIQSSVQPSPTVSLDRSRLVPGLDLRGPDRSDEGQPPDTAHATVDGVALLFFDPHSGQAHLVFASEGLAAMVGRDIPELLGLDLVELFAEDGRSVLARVRHGLGLDAQRRAEQEVVDLVEQARPNLPIDLSGDLSFGLPPGLPIDLDAADPANALVETLNQLKGADSVSALGGASLVVTQAQNLARASGRPLPVHATYTAVPSMTPLAPYVVAEFRDLEQPSAERLLADQVAVVRSLGRGYELGRICHQVANQVEQDLADGSRCWVAAQPGEGPMEPVLAGGLPFDVVEGILAELAELGEPLSRRVVAVGALSEDLAQTLTTAGIQSLWYLPLIDEEEGRSVCGAMVVATPRRRPSRPQARTLEHMAAVLASAVVQATTEAGLAHQALHDPLTGLPNRALVVDRLGQVMARLERDDVALSVLLVDIDRFKRVNDSLGAEVGDQVLLEVAGRLLSAVRLGDTVGRISSDQYLVMCAASRGELDGKAVGRRILRSLAEPICLPGGEELHITASVGLVVVDERGQSPSVIIGNAESALARATSMGRGQLAVFEVDHRHHAVERHITEQALHRAIRADELVIHYQPLVEVRTGYMIGAEALVRWERPGHGLVGPGDFIPIAEESELIIPVGVWIIDRVCRDLARWPRSHGRSPMVSVNLGARQLADDTLVPTVVNALRRNGLDPRRVCFEITESMEIRDAEAAVVNLDRLKELGCRIAIDDFGIGHATLEYIRRFSMADALKIDRSFVAGLGASREDTAIVDASIALASSLGFQVVAEGVEELEQLDALWERGVRYAQGYYLGRAVPFDEVLVQWRAQSLVPPRQLDEPESGPEGELPTDVEPRVA